MKLHLPFPVSVNAMYRNPTGRDHVRHRIKTKKYKAWIKAAESELGVQQSYLTVGPVYVTIAVKRPDKRKRDLDNLIKPVLDFLVAHSLIEDDSKVESLTIFWWVDKYTPCDVLVSIDQIVGATE